MTWRYGSIDSEFGEWTLTGLDPGASKALRCQRTIMRTYTTRATVDVDDGVEESDEGNNEHQGMAQAS